MFLKKNFISYKIAQKYLFQLLVLLTPTQLAYHFWPVQSFIRGARVDYLSPTFYLTDLIIILILGLWFLYEIRNKLSTGFNPKILFVLLFVLLNIIFAVSPVIAAFKWVKLVMFFLIAFYITRQKNFETTGWFVKPLIISLILVVLIGAGQFILRKSLGGPFYFLGERNFTINTSGISLVYLFGENYLRAYSVFSHPNSLAGYLLVSSILILINTKRLLYSKQLKNTVVLFASIGLVLTFSKTAFITLFFLALGFFTFQKKLIRKKYLSLLFILFSTLSLFLPAISRFLLTRYSFPKSIYERLVLADISGMVISENPVIGVGLNNFFLEIPKYAYKYLGFWVVQPVHNIYLPVTSETGILGLIIFVLGVSVCLTNSLKNNKTEVAFALFAIGLTGMADHYWLTLQQKPAIFSGFKTHKNTG